MVFAAKAVARLWHDQRLPTYDGVVEFAADRADRFGEGVPHGRRARRRLVPDHHGLQAGLVLRRIRRRRQALTKRLQWEVVAARAQSQGLLQTTFWRDSLTRVVLLVLDGLLAGLQRRAQCSCIAIANAAAVYLNQAQYPLAAAFVLKGGEVHRLPWDRYLVGWLGFCDGGACWITVSDAQDSVREVMVVRRLDSAQAQ